MKLAARRIRMPLLWPVLCLLFMTLFAFTLFLSYEYSKQAAADVDALTLSKMKHSYQNTQFTFDNIRSYGISIYQDASINSWLISDRVDVLMDADAFNSISRFSSLQPFIHAIYLINTRTRRILDSSTRLQGFDEFYDKNMIRSILEDHPSYIRLSHHEIGSESYISMTIPGTQASTLNYGYLVLVLDQKSLQQFLFQNEDMAGVQIAITDKDKQTILGDSSIGERLPLAYDELSAKPFEPVRIQRGNERFSVSAAELPLEHWVMHFIVNEKEVTKNISGFKQKIAASCIVLMAAMFVLFIWSIRKTLRPFRTLSAELQSKLGSDKVGPSKGEADIIRSGFNYLLTSIQDMNDSLHDYRAIAKEQFLREWLLQGTPQIPNGGIAISPLSEFDFLHVSVIRIESYKRFVETYNYNSRKLLKYAMGNISEEVLREKGYVSDWVDMGSDHLVLLIGASGEGDQADQLLAALTTVGRQIETYLRLHTAIACSSRLSIKDSLKQDYQDTYELTLLKFFTGVDKVYNEEDLEASFQSEQSYPDEGAMNELIAAIKQNAQQHIPGLLDRLLNHLKGVSYNQFLFQLQMIVFTIFKSFNRVTTMKETLVTELTTGRFSSLDEARGWLESEIRQVMESLSQPNAAGRKAEIVQEINDYVRNHLQDPFLSADTIADHLGYSSSYLRRLYKEAAQTTLADYILSERIEQVKQYLLRTDETLAVIAAKTGFQTRSHFFSTFKKSTGLTPSQYRESMAE